MRLLILLSLALSASAFPGYVLQGAYHGPPAPLAHDGRVVDTPEVAHAKAAHLAAHAAEVAKVAHHGYASGYAGEEDYASAGYGHYVAPVHGVYHGPPAPLAHDGRVIDTPEVAHAKAAHLAAHAEQVSKIAHLSYGDYYAHPRW